LLDIVAELKGRVLETLKDQNGNHVIQKCFETSPIEALEFIVKDVEGDIDNLVSDPCGCRVIQKILEHSPVSSPKLTNIYTKLMLNREELCFSPFGNYIIQHILDKGPKDEKMQLLNYICDEFPTLCSNKFASNVSEKSVIHGTDEFRKDVVYKISKPVNDKEPPVVSLIKNEFGNYVIQRLIQHGNKEVRKTIAKALEAANQEELRANNYSKHVLNILERYGEGPKFVSSGFH